MHAMCFHVKFGGLSCSLRSSASWTRLMNSFDGILMSPFAISVSSVPRSIEEELKTELELSRFAMSNAGPISENCHVIIRRLCGDALVTPLRNVVFITQRLWCFEASLYNQSCRLPSLLLCTLGLPPLSVCPTQLCGTDRTATTFLTPYSSLSADPVTFRISPLSQLNPDMFRHGEEECCPYLTCPI